MKLRKDAVVQHTMIKAPRWKQRVIGIASYRVGQHNAINSRKAKRWIVLLPRHLLRIRRYYKGL